MLKLNAATAGVIAILASRVQAANEITVQIWAGGGSPRATVQFDAGENVNASNGLPTIQSSDTRVNIFSTGTIANAGRVTFVADSRSSDLEVFVGTGSFPTTQVPLTARAVDWAGIAALPSNLDGKVRLAGAISGGLTGSITVKELFRLEVGGAVAGAVEATASGAAIGELIMGSSSSAGTISAPSGNITDVTSTSTSAVLAGSISALNGSIGGISAKRHLDFQRHRNPRPGRDRLDRQWLRGHQRALEGHQREH